MQYTRLLLQSIFILFLTGLFGSNALARMNGEAAVLDPWGNVEQVAEAENESTENSFHPEDLSGAGFDGDDTPEFLNLVGLKDLRGLFCAPGMGADSAVEVRYTLGSEEY